MDARDDQLLAELLRLTEEALRLADRLALFDPARHLDAARVAVERVIDPDTTAGSFDDRDYLPLD